MDRQEFFHRYLIAELFTPHVESAPAFVLAPVKTDCAGIRTGSCLSDARYARAVNQNCIFRDPVGARCEVHQYKPFGCSLLLCGKMTRAKAIMLNKTYYYHHWVHSQEILFSVFPQLIGLHRELLQLISNLPGKGLDRRRSLTKGNLLIGGEIATLMNGVSDSTAFYRLSSEDQTFMNR